MEFTNLNMFLILRMFILLSLMRQKCFNFKFKYSRRQLLINKKLLDRYLSNEEYDLYIDLQEENEFTIKGRYSLLDEETQFLEELIPSSIPFVGEVDSKK